MNLKVLLCLYSDILNEDGSLHGIFTQMLQCYVYKSFMLQTNVEIFVKVWTKLSRVEWKDREISLA